MAICKFFCPFLLAVFVATSTLSAQETADSTSGGAQAPQTRQPAADSAKAEFEKRHEAWKQTIKEIDLLRVEYQSADAAGRKELQKQLQEKFESANSMVSGVIEAALAAYEASGGEDDELTKFLVAVAAHRLSSDLYEEALPIIEQLTAEGVEHEAVPMWGAIAAFAVADYEGARDFFAEADETGILSQPPQSRDQREMNLWQLAMSIREIVNEHQKAWAKEKAIRAAEAEADDLPRVLLKTTKGEITLELFENEAPNTVKNFVTLVEQGVYDGAAFHRVLSNFMAQGGDPTTAGKRPLSYTIPCECYQPDARKHFRGSLSMAHAGRDTGSAQFFLTFRPTPHLDGKTFYPESTNDAHTVFGRVIEGLPVLAALNRLDPSAPPQLQAAQPEPDRILEATVLRKRPGTDYSDFKKLTR